jgi:putative FmdB family regulatory protein
MKTLIYEFECNDCGLLFEKYGIKISDCDKPRECPHCEGIGVRRISMPHFAYQKMGLDAKGCPTAGDKWARIHEKEGKRSEDPPNLRHA